LTCEFSLQHYFETLEEYEHARYNIIQMKDAKESLKSGGTKFLILRHDVDISLPLAARFAEEEAKRGIRSTYYFLVYSQLYNLSTPKSIEMLRQITRDGHEIGLHVDTKNMINMQKEVRWLEMLSNQTTETYSQYLVSETPALDSQTRAMNRNLVDANDMVEDRGIKYLTESGKNWREGCLCQHVDSWDRIQVVIHPEWWISPVNPSKTVVDAGLAASADLEIGMKEWHDRLAKYLKQFGETNIEVNA
jgi:hypothetical protein